MMRLTVRHTVFFLPNLAPPGPFCLLENNMTRWTNFRKPSTLLEFGICLLDNGMTQNVVLQKDSLNFFGTYHYHTLGKT